MRCSLLLAFLIQFFAPRFDHLIVRRFFDPAADEFFADVFVLVETVVRHRDDRTRPALRRVRSFRPPRVVHFRRV